MFIFTFLSSPWTPQMTISQPFPLVAFITISPKVLSRELPMWSPENIIGTSVQFMYLMQSYF